MEVMPLATAAALVAVTGLAGFAMVLRSRFRILADAIDADRAMTTSYRVRRPERSRRRHVKSGHLARLGYRHHRERNGSAFA